jgi:hypothetical protein
MNNSEKIKKLNSLWYDLICGEYHKDRDCHFYIYSHYYYGDSVEYIVEHKGYINHHYEDTTWETYEQAELELIRLLKEMLITEIDWYLSIPENVECDERHCRFDNIQLEEFKNKIIDI